MRSTFASPLQASIFVEGLRARPAFFVAAALVLHALVWTLCAWIADPTPHPKLAIGTALGREWLLGYPESPPLAFWIMEIAFRIGGVPALYALAPLTVALAGWFVFLFARRIVGDRYGALATFLMAGVHPVAFPVGAFDADTVQMPLIAMSVLLWWTAVSERNRLAWLGFGFVMGLSAYAGVQGIFSLAVLLALTFATPVGRVSLRAHEMVLAAVGALFLFTLIITPRVIWLAGNRFAGAMPDFPASVEEGVIDALGLAVLALLGHAGIGVLAGLSSRYGAKDRENAPMFVRPPLLRFGRIVVLALATAPLALALFAAFVSGWKFPAAALAPLTLYSGLLVMVLVEKTIRIHRQRSVAVAALTLLFLPPAMEIAVAVSSPYAGERGRPTNWPAAAASRFVTEVYRTRTGKQLDYVIGELTFASTIALLSSDRPHVFVDGDRRRSPWIDEKRVRSQGAVVLWRIAGADAAPPLSLSGNLPPLTLEAPVSNRWVRHGSLNFARFGWAILPADKAGN
jgi:hypothetical protein